MRAALENFVAHTFADDIPEVEHLVDTSGGGRSRQNWAFDLKWPSDGRCERLILRRDPVGGLVETDRAREFALLRALEETAVPSPAARWLDSEGKWFERPTLVMERIHGVSEYRVLNGDLPLPERRRLAVDLCHLLADVHAVDWTAPAFDGVVADPGEHAAAAELARWAVVFRRDQTEAYPEIDLALAWLGQRAPATPVRVLVHGDFKPGNVLLDGTTITALLDWELAHVGDPMEDLGWMTQPLRRREHLIAGAWDDDELIGEYAAVTGRVVDRDSVRWWNAFATLRTAIMQVSGLRSYLEGRSLEPWRPTRKVLGALLDAVES